MTFLETGEAFNFPNLGRDVVVLYTIQISRTFCAIWCNPTVLLPL